MLQATSNPSGVIGLKQEKWRKTIQGWKQAVRGDRCIVIGDLNLYYEKLQQPESYQVKMVDVVKNLIETMGFYRVITGITRSWATVRAGSDHNLITVRVRMNDRVLTRQEVEKRIRRNMDTDWLKNHMKEVDWSELLLYIQLDVINGILEKEIQDAMDTVVPVKVIQVRRNYRKWVNTDQKDKRGKIVRKCGGLGRV